MHEAQLHEHNWFVTLTYREVPEGGSLRPKDFQDFMKRLRHKKPGVRFMQCGEYGELLSRPHHHAVLFNADFPDARRFSGSGARTLYTSEELAGLWGHGLVSLGMVTFQSAGYVARYTLKKVHGPDAVDHYRGRVPEYLTMSRRPGIGRGWIERFGKEVAASDTLVVNGHECKPPRYYDSVLEKKDPRRLAEIKETRAREAREKSKVDSPLSVKEAVKLAAIRGLRRGMEES